MRITITLVVFVYVAAAQNASSPSGAWLSSFSIFEQTVYQRLQLEVVGSKLTGKLENDNLEGTFENGRVEGTVTRGQLLPIRFTGTFTGDRITGSLRVGENDPRTWEAVRQPPPRAPQTHTFEPSTFHNAFADSIPPVLHLAPGDTVKTWSVDAGGTDPKGVRRNQGGNPLTGPFYIDGAFPGDTLVVHFNRIRLNRDSAISSPLIVNGALAPGYVEQRKPVPGYNSDWKLDLAGGYAMLAKPTETMKDYKVPLAPMLGCVGVAPGGNQSFRSGYLGGFGGNMDYNQLREGVTVYLQVNVPGALLYMGDGHATQGAGELTGNALETSMDIEFTVDVQRGGALGFPRMENADYLMASGIAGSLDDAFRQATTNLTRCLETKYKLNAAEVSSVLGTAMVYDIAEVVDPQVHVVAKVPKSVLAAFPR
jgi:acetamidase/formamidase